MAFASRRPSRADKKVNGRKHHLVVDTLGMVAAVVQAAHIQDRDGATRKDMEEHRDAELAAANQSGRRTDSSAKDEPRRFVSPDT